ncbi:MAG TPA: HupE/UreJ family protein [Planctomycetota bacterium]|nr:HupE/UreJ family protein [Planctomycetota bacterium]
MKPAWTLLFVLSTSAAALAHDEKFSSSRVEVKDDVLTWAVDVSLQGLGTVLTLPAPAIDLTERQLQAFKPEILKYLRSCMRVQVNGVELEPEDGALEPVYETFVASGEKYIAHFWQTFRYRSTAKISDAVLSGAFFATRTEQHHAILVVSWDGAKRSFSRYGPFDLELTARRVQPTLWSTGGEFLVWGMHHIFIGYDHIAFLLALMLGAKKLGEMVRIATSFTVAHSITLLLAALDVVHLPSTLTESLIAASIVYVAAENYFLKEAKYRWVLTFLFGLVHGLGFSSVLHERLQDLDSVAIPVLSFNLGVELGQLAILLVAFPILTWIRKGPDEATSAKRQVKLVRIGSAPILLLGLFWLMDRVFQKGWMPF